MDLNRDEPSASIHSPEEAGPLEVGTGFIMGDKAPFLTGTTSGLVKTMYRGTPPQSELAAEWQLTLIGFLAQLEHHRLLLTGTRLVNDSEEILGALEQMGQKCEELARTTTFAESTANLQMTTMAHTGALCGLLADARRPVTRSILVSVMKSLSSQEKPDQVPLLRNCLDEAYETFHAYFALFTEHFNNSKAARGWVDAATAFLSDFRQDVKDWPE